MAATVEKLFNKVPIAQLPRWAERNATASDTIVLEASGNSFHAVRRPRDNGRKSEPVQEISAPQSAKIGKIISKVGEPGLRHLGSTRRQLRERIEQSLLTGRSHTLDPTRSHGPAPPSAPIPSDGSAPVPAT